MIIYSIYKITNLINGKCYVGFGINPKHRWHSHVYASKNENTKSLIAKAIRKYGKTAFIQEILYQSSDQKHCRQMETVFINECNSQCVEGYGYNISYGGEGELGNKSRTGMKHSPESIKKMSENRKGKGRGTNNAMANPIHKAKMLAATQDQKYRDSQSHKMKEIRQSYFWSTSNIPK